MKNRVFAIVAISLTASTGFADTICKNKALRYMNSQMIKQNNMIALANALEMVQHGKADQVSTETIIETIKDNFKRIDLDEVKNAQDLLQCVGE